jgi:hypothetical protein
MSAELQTATINELAAAAPAQLSCVFDEFKDGLVQINTVPKITCEQAIKMLNASITLKHATKQFIEHASLRCDPDEHLIWCGVVERRDAPFAQFCISSRGTVSYCDVHGCEYHARKFEVIIPPTFKVAEFDSYFISTLDHFCIDNYIKFIEITLKAHSIYR